MNNHLLIYTFCCMCTYISACMYMYIHIHVIYIYIYIYACYALVKSFKKIPKINIQS